ncbi:MAG: hypothetical protein HYT87_16910 [Nitrospirae bacterium]|nr:hypothetical protein [Nitrospirota bacterium]
MASRRHTAYHGAMDLRKPFTQAAIAYLVYGLLYEGFALQKIVSHGLPPGLSKVYAAFFLTVGLLITLLFPYLLFKGHRWFARLLSVFVGLRALAIAAILLGLPLPSAERGFFFLKHMSSSVVYGISLAVTLVALWFLAKAGWIQKSPESS